MECHALRALALALATTLATAGAGSAQSLDAASQDALRAALQMLLDPAARGAALGGSPGAAAADRQAQSLVGAANTEELYALAAAVFEDVVRGSGGDVAKIGDALEKGRTDPAGFAALLSPSTLDRLRALATRASDQRR